MVLGSRVMETTDPVVVVVAVPEEVAGMATRAVSTMAAGKISAIVNEEGIVVHQYFRT